MDGCDVNGSEMRSSRRGLLVVVRVGTTAEWFTGRLVGSAGVDAVASVVLGGVERSVGGAEQGDGVSGVAREGRDAGAGGDALLDGRDPDRGDRDAECFGDLERAVDIGGWEQQEECFAAVASHEGAVGLVESGIGVSGNPGRWQSFRRELLVAGAGGAGIA